MRIEIIAGDHLDANERVQLKLGEQSESPSAANEAENCPKVSSENLNLPSWLTSCVVVGVVVVFATSKCSCFDW